LNLLFLIGFSISSGQFRFEGRLSGITDIPYANGRISLNGNQYVAIPNKDGKFSFSNLLPGSYSMEISMIGYLWNIYNVDVNEDGKVKIFMVDNKDKIKLPPQAAIAPMGKAIYWKESEPYDPLKLLKSPMGIMLVVMLASSFLMPKMLETVNEQQKEMANQQNAAQQIQQPENGQQSGNQPAKHKEKRRRN